jgi:hypothetical protein
MTPRDPWAERAIRSVAAFFIAVGVLAIIAGGVGLLATAGVR